jgi:hypothetical protein
MAASREERSSRLQPQHLFFSRMSYILLTFPLFTKRMTTFESEAPNWLSEYTTASESIVPEGLLMI